MSWIRSRRPSPAMIVALIALVVALTGTAVATTSKLSGPEAKQVGKIAGKTANKRISKRAPKLTVARAHVADNATSLGGVASSLLPSPIRFDPGGRFRPRSSRRLDSDRRGSRCRASTGIPRPTRGRPPGRPDRPGKRQRQRRPDPAERSATRSTRSSYRPSATYPGAIFNPVPGIVFIYPDGGIHPITTAGSDCYERLSLDGIAFRAGD